MINDSQNNDNRFLIRVFAIAVLAVSICLNACATVRQNAIPPPPSTAKLRVFLQAVSEDPARSRFKYAVPHENFERFTFNRVGKYLEDTGIYQVVSKEDTRAVLGQQPPGSEQYWWVKKDYDLLRQAGKALYADYAMIVIRALRLNEVTYKAVLINIETGAQYTISDNLFISKSTVRKSGRRNMGELGGAVLETMYRKLFYEAKGDLLATAIRKGRLMPGGETKKPPVPRPAPSTREAAVEKKPALIAEGPLKPIPTISTAQEASKAPIQPLPIPTPESPPAAKTLSVPDAPPPQAKAPVDESAPPSPPAAKLPETTVKQPVADMKKDTETPKAIAKIAPAPQSVLAAADKRKEFEKKLEHELQTEVPSTDKAKLVVYDLDTIERLSVVALILTDALREELFILGRFSLVNRENMMQVMQELKLQRSGLVDEKEIVELGKWLAANQAVTGRLAVLGSSYVLQAKRTDIKTMGTLGLGTLKCSSGQEEELLSGIPVLARKLIGMKSNVP